MRPDAARPTRSEPHETCHRGRSAGYAHPLSRAPPAATPGAARDCRSTTATWSTENDEGMVVIDQHALHERILYEQLAQKVLAGALETQRLLVPEPVTLTPAEAAAVLDATGTAAASWASRSSRLAATRCWSSAYPAMLATCSPREVLRQAWSSSCWPAASRPTAATCWTNCCT